MKNIDPLKNDVKYIQDNPERFLPYESVKAEPEILSGIIASSACLLTDEDIILKHFNDWWIIASTFDWLGTESSGRYFNELVAFPEAGDNTFHPEILLTAFASCLILINDGNGQIISGSVDATNTIWSWIKSNEKYKRVIAFKMN